VTPGRPALARSLGAPALARALASVAIAGLAGCASGVMPPSVDLPAATPPTASEEVARLAGTFLSGEEDAAREAEDALLSLDAPRREALRAHAARAPLERDPRWLVVLDENGVLGDVTETERLDMLLAKAAHRSRVVASRGADALLAAAREAPAPLVARLRGPGPGREALAVALSRAGEASTVPALLALYRSPSTPEERRGAAFALAHLVPSAPAPRPDGDALEREEDARLVAEAWRRAEGNDATR
jgi:hypothetical protein